MVASVREMAATSLKNFEGEDITYGNVQPPGVTQIHNSPDPRNSRTQLEH